MNYLVRSLLAPPVKHLIGLWTNREYRTSCILNSRYGRVPHNQERTIKVDGWTLRVPDLPSFLAMYEAIFVQSCYLFKADNDQPRIIDCGANIGLSILYFKRLHPRARITAFEADPALFEILQHNVRRNGYSDVEMINKAVWNCDTVLRFSADGSDGGRISQGEKPGEIEVPGTRLAPYLQAGPVDLLKMDIEGAEQEVLADCMQDMKQVKAAAVEYHSFAHRDQKLGTLLEQMQGNGFRVYIEPAHCPPTPLFHVPVSKRSGMDLQLMLWFRRGI